MEPTPEKKKRDLKKTFLRLYSLARPEFGTLVVATVFLLMGSLGGLAIPQGIGFIIDRLPDTHHDSGSALPSWAASSVPQLNRPPSSAPPAVGADIDRAALVMLGVFILLGVSFSLRFYLFSNAGERVVARLRRQLFSTLMTQETAFFDSTKTGELTNRLASDTTVLQNTVSANISMALRNIVSIGGGMVALLLTSPRLSMVMLILVPPVALGAMAYGRRVRKLAKNVQDTLAKSSEAAEESLSGVRTVRSFAAEAKEVARYSVAIDESVVLAVKRAAAAATFIGFASFAVLAAAVGVFWYGSHLVISGEFSRGDLIKFLIYTFMVASSLGGLSDLWADYNRTAGAVERVFDLIERVPSIPLTGGRTLAHVEGGVKWEAVEFSYPTRPDMPVLKGLELELKPGEVVAMVGPSGAGKSTIASLLYRMYDPVRGRISLDGVPLTELDPSWLRRQVGVVAQEPLLFSTSVAENIRYGKPDATIDEVEAAAKLANAHGFVTAFPDGYNTLVGERGVQLSGGQKQRVAIARAVLKDPRILVLDEATSALDAESEHLVREALERLMKGRTTLVIAHRLSTVKGADRVVVLDNGRVAQTGTHASLVVEEGLYRKLVERQFAAA